MHPQVHDEGKPNLKVVLPVTFVIIAAIIGMIQIPSIFFSKSPTDLPTSAKSNTRLISQLQQILDKNQGTYAVYIYDIQQGQGAGLHEETVFTAASVNKIAILAAVYHLAGNNEADLEKIVVPQPDDIQDYGTGSIRYAPTGMPYSIKTLARLMMEKSDNTAAYILANHIVGIEKLQQLVNEWGMTQTDMANNKTSPKDMSILMSKMYKGEITTKPLRAEMLDFMQKSDFDDRLPKGLPEGITIYHKTGDEVGKIHDAGIIDMPNKPYFLGVFTSDIIDEQAAKDAIAEISKAVYEFMK